MKELEFNLPEGITLNGVEVTEDSHEKGNILRKIACPNCQFIIKAIIIDNFGRFSGKLIVGEKNEVWQGKLASDSDKSKKQILEVFNKKVKDHLEKCKGVKNAT